MLFAGVCHGSSLGISRLTVTHRRAENPPSPSLLPLVPRLRVLISNNRPGHEIIEVGFANLNKTHKHNLLRVLAPPPLAAAVVLLEPVVEVAEAGRVDAVAKKPAEAEPPSNWPRRRRRRRPRRRGCAAAAPESA